MLTAERPLERTLPESVLPEIRRTVRLRHGRLAYVAIVAGDQPGDGQAVVNQTCRNAKWAGQTANDHYARKPQSARANEWQSACAQPSGGMDVEGATFKLNSSSSHKPSQSDSKGQKQLARSRPVPGEDKPVLHGMPTFQRNNPVIYRKHGTNSVNNSFQLESHPFPADSGTRICNGTHT